MTETLEHVLTDYKVWLEQQPLSENTRRAYLLQVRQYGAYLATRSVQDGDPLSQPFARDYAVRDYKVYLKTEGKAKPTSVNLALSAIDHFYLFLGLDRPRVKREKPGQMSLDSGGQQSPEQKPSYPGTLEHEICQKHLILFR